MVKHFWKDWT